jgi:transposase
VHSAETPSARHLSLPPHPTRIPRDAYAEGYRLLWYYSQRKAEQDALTRAARIERALKELATLGDKLRSPRTRYRQESKVAEAVAEILASHGAEGWIITTVEPKDVETFRQARRGRPNSQTQYVRKVTTRFDLACRIDEARVAEDAKSDGIFPLVSNVTDLSELDLLKVYKRQPTIEKRFSQLKTDFEVAPVYLKAVHRIQALLSVYFFALLLEALLERELRQAMQHQGVESLPLYPEGRGCRRPPVAYWTSSIPSSVTPSPTANAPPRFWLPI